MPAKSVTNAFLDLLVDLEADPGFFDFEVKLAVDRAPCSDFHSTKLEIKTRGMTIQAHTRVICFIVSAKLSSFGTVRHLAFGTKMSSP